MKKDEEVIMGSLAKKIFQIIEDSDNDAVFVDQLKELVKKDKDYACRAIIQTLSNLHLGREDAWNCWHEILEHKEKLSAALAREVTLTTAMCDYMSSVASLLCKPKLIEIKTFEKVLTESTHDSLTGLFNRGYFFEALGQQILLAQRHDSDVSILFLDIDDFKDVNDTFGHNSGDLVLQTVAKVIKDEARTSDVVARYGGEEFVVILPHTDYISALVLAERIRAKIEETSIKVEDDSCKVTISGGLASLPVHAQDMAGLLSLADSALYRAKGAGKNNVSLFKEDKRRFLRTKLNSAVKIKEMGFQSSPILKGMSKDICIGGVLFENTESIEIGTMIQVSILINASEPILLIGTVVRVEAFGQDSYDIGVAISFKEMEKNAKDEISRFLLSQSQKSFGAANLSPAPA